MNGQVTEAQHRIEYVDGLRAVAVLSVLAEHVTRHSTLAGATARHVFMEGAHGVDLFFVLSGFCLAYPTLVKMREQGRATFGIADFGAKRIVRIVPPFYLATVLLVLIAVIAALAGRKPLYGLPPPLHLAASLLFLDGHVQLLNGSFWTLMVEFRWYFAFPLLLALWLRSPRAFYAVALACVVLYHLTRAHGLDLGTLPAFMLGIVAADVHIGAGIREDARRMIRRFALPLALVCGFAGILVEPRAWIPGIANADVLWAYQPTILGWQFAMFFFVVASGAIAPLRRALSSTALVATGVASYAIYLVHEPIVEIALRHFQGIVGNLLAGLVALAVGFAFWALAERPFTTGRLRRPLLVWITPLVARGCAFLGIPHTVELPRQRRVEEAMLGTLAALGRGRDRGA